MNNETVICRKTDKHRDHHVKRNKPGSEGQRSHFFLICEILTHIYICVYIYTYVHTYIYNTTIIVGLFGRNKRRGERERE
jgi:hypothetical protein